MKKKTLKYYFGLSLFGLSELTSAADKPNIIVILADDMGYSDLGCYGSEIETPNINHLAETGLRYRQFYNCARSCPTRASLLTGLYPHQAGMGWMASANLQKPAYQGYLNDQCVTIAEVLKTAGYKTYMSGKWHVSSDRQNRGKVKTNWPNQRGFDRYFGLVAGSSNYFQATLNNDNEQFDSPTDGSFYITNALADSATMFIDRHNFNQQPLFLYLAFTSPHWPLQAFQKDIDKYVERYKAGWDQLRNERAHRQKELGLFGKDVALSPRDKAVTAWDKLSQSQQNEEAMRMAIYAAQIDIMDQGVGRVVKELEKKGQLDNTVIMFLSDNGACAENISSGKRKAIDGKMDTFESYRINWANLSSTPYREYKHFTNEGGIATPLIVHYPKGIDKKFNNSFVDEYGHVTDIMATCVDLSGSTYPKTYKENNITPMQGVSLVPNFSGKQTNRTATFWEHEANIAMRDGKWKIVTKTNEDARFDKSAINLFDMSKDPSEMNDLSKEYPKKVEEMFNAWDKWANQVGVYPMDTREYGVRERSYNRNFINGEFDDYFGSWNVSSDPSAKIKFSIDTVNTLSGRNTARIDAEIPGEKPAAAQLKWVFNMGKNNHVSMSFKCKSLNNTSIYFRLEKVGDLNTKLVNEQVTIIPETKIKEFTNVLVPENGSYQLVFYAGQATGTIWIDDVKLTVK